MSSIAEVAQALQYVLTELPERLAWQTGFSHRPTAKLTGAVLVQTLVLGWLAEPQASLGQLCQMAASLGVALSAQGLDQRFTEAAARLLQRVLDAAVQQVVAAADPAALPLLQRFAAVT